MGTKRDANFTINNEDNKNKKANLEDGSSPSKVKVNPIQENMPTVEEGGGGVDGAQVGMGARANRDQVGSAATVDGDQEGIVMGVTVEPEVVELRQEMEDMRNDFKEDIRLMSQKFGELVLAQADSVASLKFHDNFLET